MILLDTSVISERWKIEPNASVLAWIDAQAIETFYLSAITVAALRYGIATMPEGKRRTIYQERLEHEVLTVFAGRVLAFDLDTSKTFAQLMARARAEGKAIGKADGYIAATAAAHDLMVATRDISPFEASGLEVTDPWGAMQWQKLSRLPIWLFARDCVLSSLPGFSAGQPSCVSSHLCCVRWRRILWAADSKKGRSPGLGCPNR